MPLIGTAIKRALALQKNIRIPRKKKDGIGKQTALFFKMLKTAEETQFGKHYGFDIIQRSPNPIELFRQTVPYHDYDSMFRDWWHLSINGESDVTWPGKVNYFALSSGTSGSPSKHIPVTSSMIKAIRKTSVRQILTLAQYNLPPELFEKGILMLGGSTQLEKQGEYYEGDLSGINAAKIPFWFQAHYKPGKKIARERDWEAKLEEIVKAAPDWDIGIIVGVPAWIQITIERIIKRYNLTHIHEMWPNLMIYTHGGVFFEPYKPGFEKLLGKPIHYIETYLASEGFLAYQSTKDAKGMELVLNNGIFFEFVPFDDKHFDADGRIYPDAPSLLIDQVKEGVDYAVVISTCAGAWRYLIGDTIRFVSAKSHHIIITGRTKHYLSICGEHLSVDNMNSAIMKASEELNVSIPEFCLAGQIDGNQFSHHWYIGCDTEVDAEKLQTILDETLKKVNDDYKVERRSALKHMYVKVLPVTVFYDWMRKLGKEGGQNKFPRVLKKEQHIQWKAYLAEQKL